MGGRYLITGAQIAIFRRAINSMTGDNGYLIRELDDIYNKQFIYNSTQFVEDDVKTFVKLVRDNDKIQ